MQTVLLLVVAMSMDPLLHALVVRDLMQYPDKTLYKAAAMLKPEDRPKVPVRLFDPNDGTYERELAGLGVKVPNPRVRAFTNPNHSAIFVNRKRQDAWSPYKTAATLAHEQVHIGGTADEASAYDKEAAILRAFGRKVLPEDVSAALAMRAMFRK